MPTELHCLLVGALDYLQDTIVKCKRHEMAACSVTEVQSHDKGKKGGRSVTGVHRSVYGGPKQLMCN